MKKITGTIISALLLMTLFTSCDLLCPDDEVISAEVQMGNLIEGKIWEITSLITLDSLVEYMQDSLSEFTLDVGLYESGEGEFDITLFHTNGGNADEEYYGIYEINPDGTKVTFYFENADEEDFEKEKLDISVNKNELVLKGKFGRYDDVIILGKED